MADIARDPLIGNPKAHSRGLPPPPSQSSLVGDPGAVPHEDRCPYTTWINGFAGGSTSPISTAGTPESVSAVSRAAVSARRWRAGLYWRGDLYFGGQSGGQGLQQSRAGDSAAARTGWAPAWLRVIADPNRIKKATSRRVIFIF